LPLSSLDLTLVNFLLWRALQHKTVIKTSQTLITESTFCYAAGSIKPGVLDELLKRVAVGFRVHSRHAEFLLTY